MLDADRNMPGEFKKTKTEQHRFVNERIDHSSQLNSKQPLMAWF